jgi:hypothetical protein
MKKTSLELIIRGLNDAGVQYLLVGGLAVNAHGYFRATVDVDLILEFSSANVLRALGVLKALGYAPRIPEPMERFADAQLRETWAKEKNMKVFSLYSDRHQETEVDLFIRDPLGFASAYSRAQLYEVAPNVAATVCGLADLLELKRQASRDKDLLDIKKLTEIHEKP